MKALILAAGLGERLRPLTLETPKPLIDVHGKPILQYSIDLLHEHGIYQVIANVHYKAEMIIHRFYTQLLFFYERELLDTAGTVYALRPWFDDDDFIVLNGDTISNVDLTRMVKMHKDESNDITIFTKDNAVHNGGAFVINPRAFDYYNCDFPSSLHGNWIPELIAKNARVGLYFSNAYYFDTATVEKLEKVRKFYEQT